MLQLQSSTSIVSGVCTSKRTAPQWQPPPRQVMLSDIAPSRARLAAGSHNPGYLVAIEIERNQREAACALGVGLGGHDLKPRRPGQNVEKPLRNIDCQRDVV